MTTDKELKKTAEDFITVEIKPRDLTEGTNCMQSFIQGFRLAEKLRQHDVSGMLPLVECVTCKQKFKEEETYKAIGGWQCIKCAGF